MWGRVGGKKFSRFCNPKYFFINAINFLEIFEQFLSSTFVYWEGAACFVNSSYFSGFLVGTALRNHNRIDFEETSSWTPSTMFLAMKTTPYQIYIKQLCSDFYYKDLIFERDWRKCIFKEIRLSYKKKLIKLGFSDNPL